MDKIIKIGEKVISIFLIVILIFSYNVLNVSADVPVGQIVVGNSGTWTGFPFTYNTMGKYFTVSDPTGIPTSTYLSPNYFYTPDNEKFFVVDGIKLFTYALNNIIGVISEPNELNTLFTNFLNSVNATDTTNNKYIANALYDSNDNFLGIALNDISGCYYGGNPPADSNVKDDGNYSNNVKNYIDYSNTLNSDIIYFTYYTLSNNYVSTHLYNNLTNDQLNYFNDKVQEFTLCYGYVTSLGNGYFGVNSGSPNSKFNATVNPIDYCLNMSGDTNWNKIIKYVIGNELLATDLMLHNESTDYTLQLQPYYNNSAINQYVTVDSYNQSMTTVNSNFYVFIGMKAQSQLHFYPFNIDKFTVYKDSNSFDKLDTQVYKPDYYVTDNFKDYDLSENNSINSSFNKVSQSVTNNSSIYNQSSDNYYNYYDNGVYDSSSQINNVTNITNNYYNQSEPDNPDNPDNPDDPSDVLEQILAALIRFFNAIGAVLGTILTGILTVVSQVLEAIASITVSLTSITDFLSAIFSWIPQPVPQILGLGFSICILCGIIKFIRG